MRSLHVSRNWGRPAELGPKPGSLRAFLAKYQDRILFSRDAWVPEEHFTCFRVLETADEYIDDPSSDDDTWSDHVW
ncbi:MAG: hypothetical protein KFF73_07405 [Cyclobacteriaceae bacterium]|nr:hypothetical protein [Cyclobacteriaceae bacterium]